MRALIEAFAENERELALARNLDLEVEGAADELLKELDSFSDRWDTRQGRERHLAAPLDLTPEQERLAFAVADLLGMRGEARPSRRRYDHLLVLGGTVGGCLFRAASAAHLVNTGQVITGSVTALGGYRQFIGDEFALAQVAGAPHLVEEYEALDYATCTAFDLGQPDAVESGDSPHFAGRWRVRCYYQADHQIQVRVVAAPSREPAQRRANTSDTFAFFAEKVAALRPGERILVVTSSINVPAQHAVALRMLALPYGVDVNTVGHVEEVIPPALRETETAAKYLLELRSFIRSLRELDAALGVSVE